MYGDVCDVWCEEGVFECGGRGWWGFLLFFKVREGGGGRTTDYGVRYVTLSGFCDWLLRGLRACCYAFVIFGEVCTMLVIDAREEGEV